MTTEQVHIPDRQADFIRQLIAEGRFVDIHEVIRAGVQALEERLERETRQKEKLGAMLDEALAGGLSDRTPQEIWDAAKARYLGKNA